jgi:hypothetical protein
MATIRGDQTITVNSVARTYYNASHSAYSKLVAKGNTTVKFASIAGGESLFRVTHEDQSVFVERHVVSLEDRIKVPERPAEPDIVRIQVTITCPSAGAYDTEILQLASALLTHLNDSGRLQEIVNGAKD